jgi:P pilus assembly chaperone PapD
MSLMSTTGKNSGISCNGLAFFFAMIILCCCSKAQAQGDLFVNPKRVVFEGQKRFQEINLANIGTDTARYIMSFIEIRMKPDGDFEAITNPDSGQNFASKYLRIFPRTVTLGPKESQVMKIQINQNYKLSPGEYRSHLYFRGVPRQIPLGERSPKDSTKGMLVKLTPVYGLSIPVIIRVGENNTTVAISDLKFEKQNNDIPIVKFRFNRTGNMSVYGDVSVQLISDAGKVTEVGFIKGVSVYVPNKFREVRINLDNKAGGNYSSGKLRVLYTMAAGGRSEKLATAELKLK